MGILMYGNGPVFVGSMEETSRQAFLYDLSGAESYKGQAHKNIIFVCELRKSNLKFFEWLLDHEPVAAHLRLTSKNSFENFVDRLFPKYVRDASLKREGEMSELNIRFNKFSEGLKAAYKKHDLRTPSERADALKVLRKKMSREGMYRPMKPRR